MNGIKHRRDESDSQVVTESSPPQAQNKSRATESLSQPTLLVSTAMYAKLLTQSLLSILLVALISSIGTESCPCHTKRAARVDNPTNSSVAIVNVTKGIGAINRLVVSECTHHKLEC